MAGRAAISMHSCRGTTRAERPRLAAYLLSRRQAQCWPQLSTHGRPCCRVCPSELVAQLRRFVIATVDAIGHADRIGAFPLIGEFRRVLQDQDGARRCNETATGGLEMTSENVRFSDAVVREEAIGRLRVRPVLTGQRDACSDRAAHPLHQLPQSPAKALICKTATGKLLITSWCRCFVHAPSLLDSVPDKESQEIQPKQEMWVIESLTGRLLSDVLANINLAHCDAVGRGATRSVFSNKQATGNTV